MDSEDFKEKIEIAKEAVKNQEEPFKTEAFKMILEKLLSPGSSAGKTRTVKKLSGKSSSKSKLELEKKHEIKEITSKCKISESDFNETITIKNNIVEIVKRIEVKENVKHVAYGSIILTVYSVLYELEWVPSGLLKKCLDMSGVGDLGHLSRSIKKTSLIMDRGEVTGTEYKVTGKGMDVAFDYISKLSKDEKITEK